MGLDITSLISTALLSGNTLNAVSDKAKTDKKETSDILSAALPTLLSSVIGGGKKNDSLGSLVSLLAAPDNEDEDEDEETGDSILTSLLGGKTGKTSMLASIAQSVGLDADTVKKVLIVAAPLIIKKVMSLVSTDISGEEEEKKTSSKKTESSSKKTGSGSSKKTGSSSSKKTGTSSSKKTSTSKKTGSGSSKKTGSSSSKKKTETDTAAELVSGLLGALLDNDK